MRRRQQSAPTLRRGRRRAPCLSIGYRCLVAVACHVVLFAILLAVLPSVDNARAATPAVETQAAGPEPDEEMYLDQRALAAAALKATSKADGTPKSVTIAYAISITACGGKSEGVTDGAAVLAHSIRRQSESGQSRYGYKLYAFVHPTAAECSTVLPGLGFEVKIVDTPINATQIEGEFLRRTIQVRGCCQEKELLKLYSYTLLDHPVAIHLDVDSLILKPLDYLFDVIIDESGKSPSRNKIAAMFGEPIPTKVDAFFTRDYNLVKSGKRAGVQGGFLVVRPSLSVFEEYKSIILKGRHFRGSGWDGKGHGGYYGAQQIQGLCAHYYDFVRPGTAVELNRCLYNAMVDAPKNREGKCRTGEKNCDDCRAKDVADVISAHFTVCQKPWVCPNPRNYPPLCKRLHHEWFKMRKDLEEKWAREGGGEGRGGGAEDAAAAESGTYLPDHFLGYCKSMANRGYIPLKVPRHEITDEILR